MIQTSPFYRSSPQFIVAVRVNLEEAQEAKEATLFVVAGGCPRDRWRKPVFQHRLRLPSMASALFEADGQACGGLNVKAEPYWDLGAADLSGLF